MKTARYWIRGEADAVGRGGSFRATARGWSDESLDAARAKAIELARRVAERVVGGGGSARYPYGDRPLPEPILREFSGAEKPRAMVTRNRYGAVVLNTDRMMFVDVDRKPASHAKSGLLSSLFGKSKIDTPAKDPMIEAMNVVTTRHQLAARVYETAAGYRLIITNAPFEAGSAAAEALLGEYHSDPLYIRLCRMQESFRARLSPKPWRCNFHAPPDEFPFETAAAQSKFENWEREYNLKAAAFATCRFISELGSGGVDPDFKDLIDFHDHETKAFAVHKLA
jgi:hypothetical protein